MQRATSFVLAFFAPLAAVGAQSITRVSVDSGGNQGNGVSVEPVTSSDGRFTAFTSVSTNFVTDTNNTADIFRRDNLTLQTVLVSVNTSGGVGSSLSRTPAISPTGRFVVFDSHATDLVAGDVNGNADIFARDMVLGTTELVSQSSGGVQGDSFSQLAEISNDGRYVVFVSLATNLVTGDTNNNLDVFVRDRTLQTTIRVNVSNSGAQAIGLSGVGKGSIRISGNGRHVTFTSNASNLVAPDTNGGTVDVFARDLQLSTTTVVSLDSFGNQGNLASGSHSISFDGRFIAFASSATNLVASDTNNRMDVFVRDRTFGLTSRASLSSAGVQTDADSGRPSMSQDGRYVAFESNASNLVPSMPLQKCVYVRDRATGLTTIESVNTAGNTPNGLSQFPAIASNGRYVVFESQANDLVLGDTNGSVDVFQRDRGALPQYLSYCFGDGFSSSCPCANESDYGLQEGCKYAQGYGGKLTATGNPDVVNDTFVLRGSQLGSSACQYFQGTTTLNNGLGIPFGDGLLCVGSTIVRLAVKLNVAGVSQYPDTGDLPITGASVIPTGSTRTYQIWFRDSVPYCTSATYNLTNAIEVVWSPCPNC